MSIVDRLKQIVLEVPECDWNSILAKEGNYFLLEQLAEARTNILRMGEFYSEGKVLELQSGYGPLTGAIAHQVKSVTCIEADLEKCEINKIRLKEQRNVSFLSTLEMEAKDEESKFDRIVHLNGTLDFDEQFDTLVDLLNEDGMLVFRCAVDMVQSFLLYSQTKQLACRCYKVMPNGTFPFSFKKKEYLNESDSESGEYIIQVKKGSFGKQCSLFCKYSNERSREFSIVTEIILDEQGEKLVQKYNCFPEGSRHIARMVQLGKRLDKIYSQYGYTVVLSNWTNDRIQMPFISGHTMTEELINLIENDSFLDLQMQLVSFVKTIRSMHNQCEFRVTDSFIDVFGLAINLLDNGNGYSKRYRCSTLSNIDLLFDNILIGKDKKYIIDYEWIFEFPIPVEFILYRSFHYFLVENNIKSNKVIEMIDNILGFSETEKGVFSQMEKSFQQYILGNAIPTKIICPVENYSREKVRNCVKDGGELECAGSAYYDMGTGYTEKKAIPVWPQKNGDVYRVKIDIPNGCREVRVDPIERSKLYFHMLSITDEKKRDLWNKVVPNAPRVDHDIFYLDTEDPWFSIKIEGEKSISINYFMARIDDDSAQKLYEELQSRIRQTNAAMQCQQIKKSKLWRLSIPFQNVYKFIMKSKEE